MDLQKRALAPVPDDAWGFLEENARDVIAANLTARKVVDVIGPLGWEHSAVSVGRVEVPANARNVSAPPQGGSSEVGFGVRMVKPLVETRVAFTLNRWELDNIARGAKDADITPLEHAAKKIAVFEEHAIYNGLELGSIEGLTTVAENTITKGTDSYLSVVARAVDQLQSASVPGPYALVLPTAQWQELLESSHGYPLEKQIRYVAGGEIYTTPNIEQAFILSLRGGDLELTLGQDFTFAFSNYEKDTITFELFESFSFRVLEPRAYVSITLQ